MYESFFHLQSRPFAAAPVVEAYYPARSIEQARQTLIRTIERAEGPGLVIGPAGTGKSLLLRMLADHFRNTFHFVHLSSARVSSRKDLLQSVLFELDLPYRDMDEGELRLTLLDFLRPSDFCPHGILLLVDEAHTLPLRLLDETRMMSNMLSEGEPRVRLVLAGDTRLDERFANPKLASFNQRVAARCYLEPLGRDETIDYVQSQIAAVGGNPQAIFSEDAYNAVYRASDGIPRLINQVCDHALVMARLGGLTRVDAAGIEEAWADLQQLPGPWDTTPVAEAGGNSIVEFGSLDDEDDTADFEPIEPPTNPLEMDDEPTTVPLAVTPPAREPVEAARRTSEPQTAEPGAAEPQRTNTAAVRSAAGSNGSHSTDPQFASAHDTLAAIEAALAAHDDLANEHVDDPRLAPFQQSVFPFGWPANANERVAVAVETPPPRPQSPVQRLHIENPFGDGFEQEEVVIDRYASLDAAEHQGLMRVYHERLGDRLGQYESPRQAGGEKTAQPAEPSTTSPGLATVGGGGSVAETTVQVADEPCQSDAEQPFAMFECKVFEALPQTTDEFDRPLELAVTPPADEDHDGTNTEETAVDLAGEAGFADELAALGNLRTHTIRWPDQDNEPADDRDLIIIDDGPIEEDEEAPLSSESAEPAETVRRMDYQQLFAQLRRN